MARRPNTRKRWSCDKEDYQVTRMTASAGDETEGIREILGRQQIIVCVRASQHSRHSRHHSSAFAR
jgi:hypothetical protein